MSINRKPEKINQKDPMSSIAPKKDAPRELLKIADSNITKTTPSPASKDRDFGNLISPSINLATIQNITEIISPITKNKPLPDSTGILVKGKKKIGNKVTNKNADRKESFPIIFEFIQ